MKPLNLQWPWPEGWALRAMLCLGGWCFGWIASIVQGRVLPSGDRLPYLPNVGLIPWLERTDFYSSTAQLYGALFAAAGTALLFEGLKAAMVKAGKRRRYAVLTLGQLIVCLDVFVTSAPDWGSLALSLVLSGGTSEFPFHLIPSWPGFSLAGLCGVVLGDFALGRPGSRREARPLPVDRS